MNNYLVKGFFIIENYSKQKIMLPNDVKLRIYVIDQLDTYFVIKKQGNFLHRKHNKKTVYSEIYAFDLQTILI